MTGVERPLAESEHGTASPRRPSSRRRMLLRLAQVALIAATLFFLATYLVRSWGSISEYEWSLHPGWFALSVVAFLLFYLAQAVAWWLVLRGCGVEARFWPTASVWGKSVLARYVPGTVFMFVGRAWMSHTQGLPVDRVSAAMVYEQALGVCSALLAVAVLFPFWEYRPGLTALSLAAIPILVALMHPRLFGPLAGRALRLLKRPPLDVTLDFPAVLALLCYFTGGWLVAGAGAWLLARATTGLGIEALPVVIIAYAFAYVAGMAAFIFPSGIGVREAILTASLAGWLPGGVALAWALLLRVLVTVVELAFVGIVAGIEFFTRRRVAG